MAHFHDLCHGNCALKYIKGILELRKLDFEVLKGQFDVKKAKGLRGLKSKTGYLRPISTAPGNPYSLIVQDGTGEHELWFLFQIG